MDGTRSCSYRSSPDMDGTRSYAPVATRSCTQISTKLSSNSGLRKSAFNPVFMKPKRQFDSLGAVLSRGSGELPSFYRTGIRFAEGDWF